MPRSSTDSPAPTDERTSCAVPTGVITLTGWIQHPDLSSEDLGGLSRSQAVESFGAHDWDSELTWLEALKVGSREWCPPGMGLVDGSGRILHLCPERNGRLMVHYHFPASRGLGKWLGSRETRTATDAALSLAPGLIEKFCRGRHEEFLAEIRALQH